MGEYRQVPVEPTEEMYQAARDRFMGELRIDIRAMIRDAIAAAPKPDDMVWYEGNLVPNEKVRAALQAQSAPKPDDELVRIKEES